MWRKRSGLPLPVCPWSRRMAVNDYITLDWCRKFSASDVVADLLKHVLIPGIHESSPLLPHVQSGANPTECSLPATLDSQRVCCLFGLFQESLRQQKILPHMVITSRRAMRDQDAWLDNRLPHASFNLFPLEEDQVIVLSPKHWYALTSMSTGEY